MEMQPNVPGAWILGCAFPDLYHQWVKAVLAARFRHKESFMFVSFRPYQPMKDENLDKEREGFAVVRVSSLPQSLHHVKESDCMTLAQVDSLGISREFHLPFPEIADARNLHDIWYREKNRSQIMKQRIKEVLSKITSGRTDAPGRVMERKENGKQVVWEIGLEPVTDDGHRTREYLEKVIQALTGHKHRSVPVGAFQKDSRRRLVILPSYVGKSVDDLEKKHQSVAETPAPGRPAALSENDRMEPVDLQAMRGFLDEAILANYHVRKDYRLDDPIIQNAARREYRIVDTLLEALKS